MPLHRPNSLILKESSLSLKKKKGKKPPNPKSQTQRQNVALLLQSLNGFSTLSGKFHQTRTVSMSKSFYFSIQSEEKQTMLHHRRCSPILSIRQLKRPPEKPNPSLRRFSHPMEPGTDIFHIIVMFSIFKRLVSNYKCFCLVILLNLCFGVFRR